jgi:hypothetical protein
VACLNLNPKEKIKRKGETQFRIKEKQKEAREPPFPSLSTQAAHCPSPCTRSLPMTHGPHLSVPSSPRSRARCPLSHSAIGSQLSAAPHSPTCPTPFEVVSQLTPLPHSHTRRAPVLASHCAYARRDITAIRRGVVPVPRSPSSPRRVRCLDKICLGVSDPGHTSIHPFPLFLSIHAHRPFLRAAAALLL